MSAIDQLARDAAFALVDALDRDRDRSVLSLAAIGHVNALRTLRDEHRCTTQAAARRRATLPDDAGDVDETDLAKVVSRVIS